MAATGYLEASAMAAAFNMLRPEDLIWSFFVNNYSKKKQPLAFDLLEFGFDADDSRQSSHLSTPMLSRKQADEGQSSLWRQNSQPFESDHTRVPSGSARGSHRTSVFIGAKFFGGEVRYVLAGSGHVAGVVNPVARPKYQNWLGGPPSGEFEDWFKNATEHKGSWWPDWLEWVTRQSPQKVPSRLPGDGDLPPICDAPSNYVRVRY